MSAQHTPGRWVAQRGGPAAPDRWNVFAELGVNERGIRTIRTIDQVLDYCGAEEAEANARLIAAAPDLLEALEALALFHESGGHEGDAGEALSLANAAIAKAKGGAS